MLTFPLGKTHENCFLSDQTTKMEGGGGKNLWTTKKNTFNLWFIKIDQNLMKYKKNQINKFACYVQCWAISFIRKSFTPSFIFWLSCHTYFSNLKYQKVKIKGVQKLDEGLEISKSNTWLNVQKMVDLQNLNRTV